MKVEDIGDDIPVMYCCEIKHDDGERSWWFWCPYCRRRHMHSAGPGHRAPHCGPGSPFIPRGYVLALDPYRLVWRQIAKDEELFFANEPVGGGCYTACHNPTYGYIAWFEQMDDEYEGVPYKQPLGCVKSIDEAKELCEQQQRGLLPPRPCCHDNRQLAEAWARMKATGTDD